MSLNGQDFFSHKIYRWNITLSILWRSREGKKVTKISISYYLLNPSTKSKPRYNRLLFEMKKRCRQSWASFDTVFFFSLRIFLTYTYKKLLIDRRNVAWSIVEDLSKESRLPFLVSLELEFFSSKEVLLFRLRISLWYKNKGDGTGINVGANFW